MRGNGFVGKRVQSAAFRVALDRAVEPRWSAAIPIVSRMRKGTDGFRKRSTHLTGFIFNRYPTDAAHVPMVFRSEGLHGDV